MTTQNTELKNLERDLVNLVAKYTDVSGQEFQKTALTVIDGYFDDHEQLYSFKQMIELSGISFAKALGNKILEGTK